MTYLPTASSFEPGRDRRAQMAQIRHDLRSPLSAILGYSEMLLEDSDDFSGGVQARLQQIHHQGTHMLQQMGQTLQPQTDTSDNIETLQRVLQQALHLTLTACEDLQTGPEGLPREWLPDLDKIGTAAAQLQADFPSLLDRYRQYQSETAPDPASPAERSLIHAAKRTLSSLELSTVQPPATSHILIVDDSPTNRDLVARQLQRQGYQTTPAANGREALQHLEQTPFHLILLDILMPEMNGYEVLIHLRQRDARPRIPVIMMSSLDEIDHVVQCIELGAEDYVAKPFNPVLLNRKISACLERDRLRQREVLFLAQSLIAEATPVPVMVTRLADGQILYANPQASQTLRLTVEQLLTRRIQDFYNEARDREELGRRLRQQGYVHGYELPCQRAHGELFWVTLSLRTLSFYGEPAALMALCDITDRKQAEEQLRQAEMKYRGIFENAAEGIYQADPQGRFLSVNQAMATLYGYATPEAMIAALTDHPTAPYVEPDSRDRISQQVQLQDRVQGIEYSIRHPELGQRWLSESVQAVRDRSGQCLYYEGIVEDVTERKREAAALKQQLAELQIEIDQTRRDQQVNEILQSDYFRQLEHELALLRSETEEV